jgi:hypothetical protein
MKYMRWLIFDNVEICVEGIIDFTKTKTGAKITKRSPKFTTHTEEGELMGEILPTKKYLKEFVEMALEK